MCGLEFYTPGKGWRQAHMQGRWAILRLMIECGAVEILVRSEIWIHRPQHCVTSSEQYDAAASSGQGSLIIHLKKDMLVAAKQAVGRCEYLSSLS
jgi:hypothetical protein